MEDRRVVVTGTGVLTSLGDRQETLHQLLCAGKDGLGRVSKFSHERLNDPIVGEITSFAPTDYLEKRNFRPLNRTALLLTSAAQLALDDSKWSLGMRDEQPVGLVAGTTFCSISTISKFDCRAITDGPGYSSPLDFANTVINAAAGQCGIWHDLRGVNSTVSSGIASSLEAISYAAGLIRTGQEQAILAGGVEEMCVESLLAFQQAGLLHTSSDSTTKRPVPFYSRNGFALSEGSALLMLEDYEAAQNRGATILGEIRGSSSSFDFQSGKTPALEYRAESIARSLQGAMDAAQLSSLEIDAVSASANGHADTDRSELHGINRVFNGTTKQMPVTATKVAVGETMGASGAIQTIEALSTLLDGRLAGVPGFDSRELDFEMHGISATCQHIKAKNCMVNSVGLDGNCCSLVVGAC